MNPLGLLDNYLLTNNSGLDTNSLIDDYFLEIFGVFQRKL